MRILPEFVGVSGLFEFHGMGPSTDPEINLIYARIQAGVDKLTKDEMVHNSWESHCLWSVWSRMRHGLDTTIGANEGVGEGRSDIASNKKSYLVGSGQRIIRRNRFHPRKMEENGDEDEERDDPNTIEDDIAINVQEPQREISTTSMTAQSPSRTRSGRIDQSGS
ncbi:unnamed protein product [Echinostoma caproni]|uniref:Bestrophin homolog n=1 Tax=Echinostoma caproni TaxID=27848 RepID=A0A183B7H5_9TREM|nr:unnamed protein product [Echinostoma caproni]